MGGVLPFSDEHDDQSSGVIKTKVSAGIRPDFQYEEYSLFPHFLHLESMMKNCWDESPSRRPKAAKALVVMQEAGFYCLRQTLDIPSNKRACLYTKQSIQGRKHQVIRITSK